VFTLWPLSGYVAAANLGAPAEWILLSIYQIARAFLSAVTFTAICIAVANAAAPQHTGTINGASQSLAAFARTIGPITGGSLWSWSVSLENHPGHQWILHGTIGIIGLLSCLIFVRRLDPVLDLPWLERQALLEQAVLDEQHKEDGSHGYQSSSKAHRVPESIDFDTQRSSSTSAGQYQQVPTHQTNLV
jgi:hypothetical protein